MSTPKVDQEILILTPPTIRYQSTHAAGELILTLADAVGLIGLLAEEIGRKLAEVECDAT